MKELYEKPYIQKLHGGVTNKFSGLSSARVQDSIEGVQVNDLVREYGSPLFVFSEKTIFRKYTELKDSFSLRYPYTVHAWSYKTNYLQAICKIFHNLGSWAEVVSVMEYEMAVKLGVKPNNIIFNGPVKTYEGMKRALKEGALVNIESMDELYDAEQIADELGREVSIGIRVNMSLEPYIAWNKFGFNIEAGYAYQAVKRAVSGGQVRIDGLHCHVGTFITEPEIYKMEVEKLIEFSKLLREDFGISIRYIDIGGGFPSLNKLKSRYLPAKDVIPSFDNYVQAICNKLTGSFKSNELPLLIHETGRGLIDEAGTLIATICATKRLSNNMRALIIDAGVNLLVTSYWYDLDITPTIDRGEPVEDHIVYGPLCMQIDVVKNPFKLPYLKKGDQVLIHPVGAYNNTQWMQFISLRPKVVLIGQNQEVSLIREAETVDYIQERERFPKWLANSNLH